MPSAAVRIAGAGVIMRDDGDKEIRFACGLAVAGCDRCGVAKSGMSVQIFTRGIKRLWPTLAVFASAQFAESQ